jgi:hypothetical protein
MGVSPLAKQIFGYAKLFGEYHDAIVATYRYIRIVRLYSPPGVHCMNTAFCTLGLDSTYAVSAMLEDHSISDIFILITILNKCGSWNVIANSLLVRFHAKK